MSWITPELIEILLTILKAVVILLVVVTCGAFMSFGERRLLGLFQNRYGPNRVGWGGSLQLVADMIKMFFKEDWIPKFSDRVIFTLAPMIAFTSLLLASAFFTHAARRSFFSVINSCWHRIKCLRWWLPPIWTKASHSR